MRYRFLEHTADVQAECWADGFEGLLEAAAEALYALALGERRTGGDVVRTVTATGDSREDILVRWLQELIFALEVDRFVATAFSFACGEEGTVRAELHGYVCVPDDRVEEVKSATYHELNVRKTDHGLVARVVFDL